MVNPFRLRYLQLFLILLLLTLPIPKPHQVADHFRLPEVGRFIGRHTFLCEANKDDAAERISIANREQLGKVVVDEDGEAPNFVEEADPVPTIPIARLLLRLRLHSRHRGTPSPLV